MSPSGSIAIIGAGVVGVASALTLAQRGYAVTVFEPHAPGMGGPSRRNAGQIGASDIQPLSTPGIMRRGLSMMLRKDGPLHIPGVEKLRLAPWFLLFLATSRGTRYARACAAMAYLCRNAYGDLNTLLEGIGSGHKAWLDGAGFIYDSAESHAASLPTWQMKQEAGFPSQVMTRADIARRLPDMSPRFAHGVLSQNWGAVTDPLEIVQDIARAAETAGVVFRREHVSALDADATGVTLTTDAGTARFGGVVIAAGIRARGFAKSLGERLPMVAERGYNLTFPNPGFTLDMPLVMPDRGIAITSVGEGLRVGGWAEYAASPERAENKVFYKALGRISAEIFPDLDQTGAIPWMGNRPSLPDSVPVISRSQASDRVFYNCGHGHYGLSFCALSANILSGQIDGGPIPDAHRAFGIDRFQ